MINQPSDQKEKIPDSKTYHVLIVNPRTPISYWSYEYSMNIVGKKSSLPPLGAITVAALLPAHYNPRLIDMNVEDVTDEDIESADLIMLSAMMIQKKSFYEIAARSKRIGKETVAGGPYVTAAGGYIKDIDYVILGEAEMVLKTFLKDWEQGQARSVYEAEDKPSMDLSPLPRYDLLKTDMYYSMSLQFSRGCPYNCEFCNVVKLFGRRMRVKAHNQVIAELDALYHMGWRGQVFVVDDNFIGSKPRAELILKTFISWQQEHDYPVTFYTEASVNIADDDHLLELFQKAGFTTVFLGIETPSEDALKESGKIQNQGKDLLESIRRIHRFGIEVTAGFIVGFDSDTEDIFDRQIEFISKSGIATAMVGLLQAFPGTDLYERLKNEGRLLMKTSGNNTHEFSLNFRPVMNPKVLTEGYKKILSYLYKPSNYYRRALVYLARKGQNTGGYLKMPVFEQVKIFSKSFIRQTFSSYGLSYLIFLIRVLLKKKAAFSEAVSLSIQGIHFFRITHEVIAADQTKVVFKKQLLEAREAAGTFFDKYPLKKANKKFQSFCAKERKKALRIYKSLNKNFRYLIKAELKKNLSELTSEYSS